MADMNKEDLVAFKLENKPYLISLGRFKAVMIRNGKVSKGILPAIIKSFIEKHYIFTRKHWHWPFNKLEL